MRYIFALVLILMDVSCNTKTLEPTVKIHYSYQIEKFDICEYPTVEILAAVAYHECGGLSKLDRWLVMEALWNRVVTNFNNNGYSLEDQLLAPKQFTGLWLYRPEEFKFDTHNRICVENVEMAQLIINGNRFWKYEPIMYWAGICDKNTTHYRNIVDRKIETGHNLKQIYAW